MQNNDSHQTSRNIKSSQRIISFFRNDHLQKRDVIHRSDLSIIEVEQKPTTVTSDKTKFHKDSQLRGPLVQTCLDENEIEDLPKVYVSIMQQFGNKKEVKNQEEEKPKLSDYTVKLLKYYQQKWENGKLSQEQNKAKMAESQQSKDNKKKNKASTSLNKRNIGENEDIQNKFSQGLLTNYQNYGKLIKIYKANEAEEKKRKNYKKEMKAKGKSYSIFGNSQIGNPVKEVQLPGDDKFLLEKLNESYQQHEKSDDQHKKISLNLNKKIVNYSKKKNLFLNISKKSRQDYKNFMNTSFKTMKTVYAGNSSQIIERTITQPSPTNCDITPNQLDFLLNEEETLKEQINLEENKDNRKQIISLTSGKPMKPYVILDSLRQKISTRTQSRKTDRHNKSLIDQISKHDEFQGFNFFEENKKGKGFSTSISPIKSNNPNIFSNQKVKNTQSNSIQSSNKHTQQLHNSKSPVNQGNMNSSIYIPTTKSQQQQQSKQSKINPSIQQSGIINEKLNCLDESQILQLDLPVQQVSQSQLSNQSPAESLKRIPSAKNKKISPNQVQHQILQNNQRFYGDLIDSSCQIKTTEFDESKRLQTKSCYNHIQKGNHDQETLQKNRKKAIQFAQLVSKCQQSEAKIIDYLQEFHELKKAKNAHFVKLLKIAQRDRPSSMKIRLQTYSVYDAPRKKLQQFRMMAEGQRKNISTENKEQKDLYNFLLKKLASTHNDDDLSICHLIMDTFKDSLEDFNYFYPYQFLKLMEIVEENDQYKINDTNIFLIQQLIKHFNLEGSMQMHNYNKINKFINKSEVPLSEQQITDNSQIFQRHKKSFMKLNQFIYFTQA